ncbi:hypothetical protein TrLO_g1996 [Triparma laevis f. longispina]|uniref:Uncharacterized protein n=1 Tax=Triparma laevis f. longispina TaxID=1714387 RepID=A0A9W7AH87_9STRA|nr:hypothetical protein TrLO_g1996 [Triparma laevis f. longispina]
MEEVLIEALSASMGGIISSSALFPLEVVKTKMQAMDSKKDKKKEEKGQDGGDGEEETSPETSPPTALGVAKTVYSTYGVLGFYKGMHFSAIQSFMEKGLYFIAYTALKSIYKDITALDDIGTISNLGLGCIAEWCHLPFTLPLDSLTTALATDTKNRSAYLIMTSLCSEKGLAGMYSGVQAFVVLCLKPAIQYTVFEKVKAVILASKITATKTLTAIEAFLLGMVARTVATIIVFPYTRAKVMLQSSSSDEKPDIPAMLKKIYEEEGVGGVFQGIGPELTRGVLSAALMLMVKEKIRGRVERIVKG